MRGGGMTNRVHLIGAGITFLILLAAAFWLGGILGWLLAALSGLGALAFIARRPAPLQSPPSPPDLQPDDAAREQVDALQAINRALAGAASGALDERALMTHTLRAITGLAGALGCSYVPVDPLQQPLPAFTYGRLPAPVLDAWSASLANHMLTERCASCQVLHSNPGACPLHPAGLGNTLSVYCLPLTQPANELEIHYPAERRSGVLHLYLPEGKVLDTDMRAFLGELLGQVAAVYEAARLRAQEQATLRQLQMLRAPGPGQTPTALEYQAVIQERARLAREIHDGLAQTLAFLKLQTAQMQNYLTQGDTTRLSRGLRESARALAEAYLDTRQAIDNLRLTPQEGLAEWLAHSLDEFEAVSGLAVARDVQPPAHPAPPEIQAQLVRIVQEALSNVRKHASARSVRVSLYERQAMQVIEVADDGLGFTAEDVPDLSRHGLRGMRERAESIGADFQIISQPGQGTTVRLLLPILLPAETRP